MTRTTRTLRVAALGAAALLTLAACEGGDDVATAVPGADDPAAETMVVASGVPGTVSPAGSPDVDGGDAEAPATAATEE